MMGAESMRRSASCLPATAQDHEACAAMSEDCLLEGEELGSNLLHVAYSRPEDPSGYGSLKLGQRELLGHTGRWLYGPTACRRLAPSLKAGSTSPSPALGLGIRPSHDSRQLKHLLPQVLYLRS
jgi:hypothetical protein